MIGGTTWRPFMRTSGGRTVLHVDGAWLICTNGDRLHADLSQPDLADPRTRAMLLPVFKPNQAALTRLEWPR